MSLKIVLLDGLHLESGLSKLALNELQNRVFSNIIEQAENGSGGFGEYISDQGFCNHKGVVNWEWD